MTILPSAPRLPCTSPDTGGDFGNGGDWHGIKGTSEKAASGTQPEREQMLTGGFFSRRLQIGNNAAVACFIETAEII